MSSTKAALIIRMLFAVAIGVLTWAAGLTDALNAAAIAITYFAMDLVIVFSPILWEHQRQTARTGDDTTLVTTLTPATRLVAAVLKGLLIGYIVGTEKQREQAGDGASAAIRG